MHREPEGGVHCQVLDFSASHEEMERSSTGSLSQGAVPKEVPGSLANGAFILVLRSFSFPLSLFLSLPLDNSRSFSLSRTWFAVGINGCQAGRPVLSSQLSHIPLPRTVQLTIKSLSPVHHHHHHHLSLSLLSSRRSYSRCFSVDVERSIIPLIRRVRAFIRPGGSLII